MCLSTLLIRRSSLRDRPVQQKKTVLAVQRARMIAEGGTLPTIVTFNRMLRRLLVLLDSEAGAAATMHSFVWHDYKRRATVRPPDTGLCSHDYDWKEMLDILAKLEPVPKIDYLIIDEGQDLPEGFYRYAKQHAAHIITVFADDDQAIEDRHTTLEQITTAPNLPNPRLLQTNHRNAPEIARVAEHFHDGRLPAANVQRMALGTRPRIMRTRGPERTAEFIATWFRNRGGSIGVIVDSNQCGEVILNQLRTYLQEPRIERYDHVLRNEDSTNINEDGITILNRASAKGQEFDSVFVLELDRLLPWRTDNMRRMLYMVCARARDYLTLIYGPDLCRMPRFPNCLVQTCLIGHE
jgi:superfamily I DNA/RNA helicase